MEIVVLNGSPKGEMSATIQYVHFIQKNFPEHKLDIINISQKLPKIEKDKDHFEKIIDKIKASDGVLWAFPLYYLLLHSNYKRFIELISENAVEDSFENKYTAVLTTSIHFFDHTAHNYMNAVCDDLNMKYVGSFSADMYDLVKEKERERLLLFAEDFFEAINHDIPTSRNYWPLTYSNFEYAPGDCEPRIDANGKTVTIVTDSDDMGTNLGKMISRFRKSFLKEPKVI